MALQYPLVHIDDIAPERMEEKEGWAISEFRLPITGAHGSSTTVFHSIFRPGSTHAKHLHTECEEIAVYLKGNGVVGQGDQRAEVREGHCRLMPKGSTHFFYNETKDEEAMVVGFYLGAPSVAGTGYQFRGDVTQADLDMPREGLTEGILVHLDDVPQREHERGGGMVDHRFQASSRQAQRQRYDAVSRAFFPGRRAQEAQAR